MKKIAIAVALSALLSGCSGVNLGLGAGMGLGGSVSPSISVNKEIKADDSKAHAIATSHYNDAQLCAVYGYVSAPLEGVVNSAQDRQYDEAYSRMRQIRGALEERMKSGKLQITAQECKKAQGVAAAAWRKEQAEKLAKKSPTVDDLLN